MNSQELSDRIEKILRLETTPVTVSLFKDRAEMPRKPLPQKLNFCQIISMARYAGRINSSVADNMVCAFGASCLGLIKTTEAISSGKAALGVYVKTPEAAKKFMANVFKIGDTGKNYDGVMVKPLPKVKEDETPDALVMYVNPLQAMCLIHASTYDSGEKITADTVAEGAMCSAIAYAISRQKPIIGFPCTGDRSYAGTQNHELVFAAPYGWAKEKLLENLERTAAGGASQVPMAPYMFWTPVMDADYTIPPEALE